VHFSFFLLKNKGFKGLFFCFLLLFLHHHLQGFIIFIILQGLQGFHLIIYIRVHLAGLQGFKMLSRVHDHLHHLAGMLEHLQWLAPLQGFKASRCFQGCIIICIILQECSSIFNGLHPCRASRLQRVQGSLEWCRWTK
jgi:hypothetical protein